MKNVIDMGKEKKFPLNGQLVGDLNKVIANYFGKISLAEAVGALELVKIGLICDADSEGE